MSLRIYSHGCGHFSAYIRVQVILPSFWQGITQADPEHSPSHCSDWGRRTLETYHGRLGAPLDPVGLGVSRSHSMASFRLFGYHIARRWNAIIGRRHVSTAGRYIPILHLQVTLHSNSSLSELLHCFETLIILGRTILVPLLAFILLNSFIYSRLAYTRL